MTFNPKTDLKIALYPAPVLKQRCCEVKDFEPLLELARKMLALMHEKKGVGLAAPQVGIPIRVFVCNVTGDPKDDRVYVNPVLSDHSGRLTIPEGCLSLPGVQVSVMRSKAVTIQAQDVYGNPLPAERDEGTILGRVWMHEMDHLDGTLLVQYMDGTERITNKRALTALLRRHLKHV